jgi:hypothetical protein
MKNTAIDILGYEERKDNEEWFDECRQLLEQKNKAYQAYLARPMRAKEQNVSREGNGLTQHIQRKKRQVVNQQLL